MIFQQNLVEKAQFIAKMSGPAAQFWLLESALSVNVLRSLTELWFACL